MAPLLHRAAIKTKARFSRLLRHPAWKQRRPILVSALHKSVTYLLRHLPSYTYSPETPRGRLGMSSHPHTLPTLQS